MGRAPWNGAWTAIGVMTFVAFLSASAADIKVIANPGVKVSQLTSDDLKGVFLITLTTLPDGSHVQPVLLRTGDSHTTFVKQYTGKTTSGLQNYYRSLVFTGRGAMPRMFKSDAELVAYVKVTQGAIGYVSAQARTEGVKVLDVKR